VHRVQLRVLVACGSWWFAELEAEDLGAEDVQGEDQPCLRACRLLSGLGLVTVTLDVFSERSQAVRAVTGQAESGVARVAQSAPDTAGLVTVVDMESPAGLVVPPAADVAHARHEGGVLSGCHSEVGCRFGSQRTLSVVLPVLGHACTAL
jgi:hypothetical protein